MGRWSKNQNGPEYLMKWSKIKDLHWSLQSRAAELPNKGVHDRDVNTYLKKW